MRWNKHDRQLIDLARELMRDEGLNEVDAIAKAKQQLEALRQYSKSWNRYAHNVKLARQLYTWWFGGPHEQHH